MAVKKTARKNEVVNQLLQRAKQNARRKDQALQASGAQHKSLGMRMLTNRKSVMSEITEQLDEIIHTITDAPVDTKPLAEMIVSEALSAEMNGTTDPLAIDPEIIEEDETLVETDMSDEDDDEDEVLVETDMSDEEDEDDEEDEVQLMARRRKQRAQTASKQTMLLDRLLRQTAEQSEAQAVIVKATLEHQIEVKRLIEQVNALASQVETMSKQFALRPRASVSAATVVSKDAVQVDEGYEIDPVFGKIKPR